jgi:hypothetical protein
MIVTRVQHVAETQTIIMYVNVVDVMLPQEVK